MSAGQPRHWGEVWPIAERLVEALEPACEQVAVAGSLRRGKPMVRDMEIVAVPRFDERPDGMFATERVDMLEEMVAALLDEGVLALRPVENHRTGGGVDVGYKAGHAFKALLAGNGVPLDLFIVRPPATWGVIFGLRTGPGDWNTRLVTECKAIGRRVAGGQVQAWNGRDWEAIPTDTEEAFYRALGQPWVEPRDRAPGRVHIRRQIAEGAA